MCEGVYLEPGVPVFLLLMEEMLTEQIRYGEMSINPDKDDFLWHGRNDVDRQIFRITGITSNPEIEKFITQKKDGSRRKAAKIINNGEGSKFWNVFYEKPFNAPVEFIAYDGDGNEILRH